MPPIYMARAPSGLPGPPATMRGRYGWRAIISAGGYQSGHSALRSTDLDARPGEAFAADADAVAHRLAVAEHVIEEGVRGIDHDRARRFFARIVDDLPLQPRSRLGSLGVLALVGRRLLKCLRCGLHLDGGGEESKQGFGFGGST